jgi:hypothetical protein
MAVEKTNSNHDNPPSRVKASLSTPIDALVPDDQETDAIKNPRKKKSSNIVVNVIQPKSSQPKIANWIAGLSVLISFGLGVITLFLFLQTKKQAKSSQDAATIAQNTFELTKKYYQKNFKQTDSIEASKFKRDTAAFNLQKKELDAQIESFQQANRKFVIDNEPMLDMSNVSIHETPNDTLPVGYTIRNSANGAVSVYSQADTIIIADKDRSIEFLENPTKEIDKIKTRKDPMMVNSTPVDVGIGKKVIFNPKKFGNKKAFFYFLGKMCYTSQYNSHRRVYSFIYRVYPIKDRSEWEWIYSSNKNIN